MKKNNGGVVSNLTSMGLLAILNPEDSDKVLLLVQDGFVLYNFADDI